MMKSLLNTIECVTYAWIICIIVLFFLGISDPLMISWILNAHEDTFYDNLQFQLGCVAGHCKPTELCRFFGMLCVIWLNFWKVIAIMYFIGDLFSVSSKND